MDRADVIILGGGLVGLALAAALDTSGLSAVVIDPADPDARKDAGFDGRATALASSSKRMFDTVGISDHFPEPGCPIRRIEVADGLAPGGLAFDPGEDGRASHAGGMAAEDMEPLGWMHENRHLRAALRARAEAGRHIDLRWQRRAQMTILVHPPEGLLALARIERQPARREPVGDLDPPDRAARFGEMIGDADRVEHPLRR